MQAAGVDFPPREENSLPLFTPPQTQPLRHPHLYTPPGQSYEDAAIQASLQSAPPAPALRLSFMCLPMWFLSSSLSDLVSFVSRSHHLCLMSKCWKEYHYTSIIILCWYFIFMLLSRLYLILLFFPCCSPCLIISKKNLFWMFSHILSHFPVNTIFLDNTKHCRVVEISMSEVCKIYSRVKHQTRGIRKICLSTQHFCRTKGLFGSWLTALHFV